MPKRRGSRARLATRLACSVLLTLAAACTTDNPPPPPTTTTSSTTTPRPTVAPPVTRTLDLTPVWDSPCGPVSQELLDSMGLRDRGGIHGDRVDTVACIWYEPRGSLQLDVSFERRDSLGRAYLDSNRPETGVFLPTTVVGQPAVVMGVAPGAKGLCRVVVGLGPEQGAIVTVSDGNAQGRDSCDEARAASEQVVRYLGG